MASDSHVGFVGVGRMGSRMATHLMEAGYDITAYDVDPEMRDRMASRGADTVETLHGVAGADVVMSSLPTSEIVEDVFLGDDGLLAAVDDGTMVVEMSTVAPESVEAMAEAVADRDVSVVDSPVIGTPPVAERSELTIPIGCSESAFERVEPIVDHLGDRIDHVGRVGNGKRVKLANNVMTFGNWALAAEMHALVGRLGLDVEQFYDITSSGIAHADIVDEKAAKAFAGDDEPGFTIDGARGDLRYALGMKEAADFPAPIAAAVAEQYDAGAALAGGDRDYSSMLEAFETLGEE